MHQNQYHSDEDIITVYHRHVDMVFKICYSYLKNLADSEDGVSLTFMKYLNHPQLFDNLEHEKAWFIVTATNVSKDLLRQKWRKHLSFDENTYSSTTTFQIDNVLDIILQLPSRYKTVIYLYYYEGYNSEEIANILNKSPSTIRNQLARARKILKRKIGDDYENN